MSAGRDVDLSGDLHGRVADFISDTDRRWFAEHPAERTYHRAALEHELCDPRHAPRCVPMAWPPEVPDGYWVEPQMEVTQIAPGIRTRRLWWAVLRDVPETTE